MSPVERQGCKCRRLCPHPACSLDLALWGIWLFLKIKVAMKGKSWEWIQDFEVATTEQLKTRKRASRCALGCVTEVHVRSH